MRLGLFPPGTIFQTGSFSSSLAPLLSGKCPHCFLHSFYSQRFTDSWPRNLSLVISLMQHGHGRQKKSFAVKTWRDSWGRWGEGRHRGAWERERRKSGIHDTAQIPKDCLRSKSLSCGGLKPPFPTPPLPRAASKSLHSQAGIPQPPSLQAGTDFSGTIMKMVSSFHLQLGCFSADGLGSETSCLSPKCTCICNACCFAEPAWTLPITHNDLI